MKHAPATPHDPQLLAPREGAVVGGHHVTLRWETAEAADRYLVQIATDAAFGEVIFEQEVPCETVALVVRRHFPEDDGLFYWRVRAGDAGGWSEGEHIEAFTSGTAEQVGRFAVPDIDEPFGPVAALFSVATLESIAEVIPGYRRRAEAALGGERPEGGEVLGVEVGLLLAAAFVLGALFFLLLSSC
jgi:hypothetical protein